ncbi:hypothetical protein syc2272_c [Synechococcus elongatus PCC 6301]|uniref:Uncharacterized protein n=1 Tax=Synechococcus sp. (strain ATCC 27144 / PCC 6301 / SAUG 1402/1) TaxID=269084 RepID=A0A0H3K5B5_SYNP6|nr:hypothetical protein syc2272_c [Synechococcus elongatus PCC 6301]
MQSMFPFFLGCESSSAAEQEYKSRKLRFLRWMRDDLKTRLAGINAAIAELEQQVAPNAQD